MTIIDPGIGSFGKRVVDHVQRYYDTTHVILFIITHRDGRKPKTASTPPVSTAGRIGDLRPTYHAAPAEH